MTNDLKKAFWDACINTWTDITHQDQIEKWLEDNKYHTEQITQLLRFEGDGLGSTCFDMFLKNKNFGTLESFMRYAVNQAKHDQNLLRFIFPYACALEGPCIIEDILKYIHLSEDLLILETHENKKTALDLACESGNEDLVAHLLDRAKAEGNDLVKKLLSKPSVYGVPIFLSLANNTKLLTNVLKRLKDSPEHDGVFDYVINLKDNQDNTVFHRILMNEEKSTAFLQNNTKTILEELQLLDWFRYVFIEKRHLTLLRFLNGGVLRNLNMYSFQKLCPVCSAT